MSKKSMDSGGSKAAGQTVADAALSSDGYRRVVRHLRQVEQQPANSTEKSDGDR